MGNFKTREDNLSLFRTRVEKRINEGRKRIDITFDNSGEQGFFQQLSDRHLIFCPKILAESKNYGAELGNPELDQLAGRFSKRLGRFGFIVCKTLKDEQMLIKRCRDILNDQEHYILVLQDKDMIALLQLAGEGDQQGINEYMMNRLNQLIF